MGNNTKYVQLVKGLVLWRYRIMDKNGQVLTTSQRYATKSNAKRAAHKVAGATNLKVME